MVAFKISMKFLRKKVPYSILQYGVTSVLRLILVYFSCDKKEEDMTTVVFVEQPLVAPGSAKNTDVKVN